MNRPLFLGFLFLVLFCAPGLAWACGSRWVITALSELRLMHFSFFMGLVIGTPLILRKMSAFYRKDFPKLPKLDYFKSLAIVLVCGLTFQLAVGLFMDTRGMTSSPKLISEEAIAKELAKLDQANLTQQDLKTLLQQIPNTN